VSVRDLFSAIERDHKRIIGILDAFDEDSDPDVPLSRRRKLAQQLVMEESRHEVAEERFLWPAVRELLEGGRQRTETGIRQEQAAKRALSRLEKAASNGGEQFEETLTHVARMLRDHVDYEESEALPRLRLRLSAEDASSLGALYEKALASGPTRPHPLTPAVPGILRTAGPAVGVIDSARDFLTRRGR
jgi:hemerythrin superfamily protein